MSSLVPDDMSCTFGENHARVMPKRLPSPGMGIQCDHVGT
jgi:hypothetical protein